MTTELVRSSFIKLLRTLKGNPVISLSEKIYLGKVFWFSAEIF